jgi:predicted ATPase
VAKTDGIPLFVEELVKTILEAGLVQEDAGRYVLTGPLPPLAIPATLQDALMARLDRLAVVKEVAQLGAVLGREFAYDLLRAVTPLDEAILQPALARLVEAELLYQRGLPAQATYIFKHALIQDAAYQSLLKSTRQQLHQRIVQVLEARFPETAETQPELLAHHYTEAGLAEQAVGYWQQAGCKATQRSAHVEAIVHLNKGLELLRTLPDTIERTQHELVLQTLLGPALIASKSFAAPEVEQAYTRARELCQQVGDTPQLFPVLRGLWVFYLSRAELRTARELGEQLLRLAQHTPTPALLLEAHRALGETLCWLGELAPARQSSEQGMSLYDPQQHRSHAFLYGEDPGVVCLSYAALALWSQGYPDQALTSMHAALTLAQEHTQRFSLARALVYGALLHQFRREGQLVQERAEAAITLSTEQGFPHWLAVGTFLRGRALAAQGQGAEGVAQMQQGLAARLAAGAELGRPLYLALLAQAYRGMGQAKEGLALLAQALIVVNNSGERHWEAELYRLKGELLLEQAGTRRQANGSRQPWGEAEACFHHALAVARRQQAKSLELRAAMSLARLWQQQGKRAEARELLAPVYDWFTEGFDTADLQDAKALLEVLT